GQDPSFSELLPFIYTNPFVIYTTEIWASENNIAHYKKDLEDTSMDGDDRMDLQRFINDAQNHKGKFVNRFTRDTIHLDLDTIYRFPEKVAILIDNKCASSAEEFLLRAVQSKKVILFGRHTLGVLDYSNVMPIWLPSQKRVFALPMSRSKRLPG